MRKNPGKTVTAPNIRRRERKKNKNGPAPIDSPAGFRA